MKSVLMLAFNDVKCNISGKNQTLGPVSQKSRDFFSPISGATIGHFGVHLSLHFKGRLSAKSVFILIEIGTSYLNKNFDLDFL